MSWNYRIVESEDCGVKLYGLHEVYYDEGGNIRSWSGASVICDTEDFSDFISKVKEASEKKTLRMNASGGIE